MNIPIIYYNSSLTGEAGEFVAADREP